jgi:hypothetical protein
VAITQKFNSLSGIKLIPLFGLIIISSGVFIKDYGGQLKDPSSKNLAVMVIMKVWQ